MKDPRLSRGRTTIDMRMPWNWLRMIVLGATFAIVGQAIYGPLLLSDALSAALHLDVLGLRLRVPAEYVGIVPSVGQLFGLVILWRTRRRSRVGVGVACTFGIAAGIAVAAAWPNDLALAGGVFVASVFTVAMYPVWSRVNDAAPGMAASGLLLSSYAIGLWVLGVLFDSYEDRHGISWLFGWFAVAILVAGLAMWLLTPREAADRPVEDGRFRDEFTDRGRLAVISIALLSGMALNLHDVQVTPLYASLGLAREDAAGTGIAFLIGGVLALLIVIASPTRDIRPKLVLASVALPVAFVLAGWPGLLAPAGTVLIDLMLLQRTGLEAGSTVITMLAPLWRGGITFMIAVQVGRGLGGVVGAVGSGVAFDLGGRPALAGVGIADGLLCLAISVAVLRRGRGSRARRAPRLRAPRLAETRRARAATAVLVVIHVVVPVLAIVAWPARWRADLVVAATPWISLSTSALLVVTFAAVAVCLQRRVVRGRWGCWLIFFWAFWGTALTADELSAALLGTRPSSWRELLAPALTAAALAAVWWARRRDTDGLPVVPRAHRVAIAPEPRVTRRIVAIAFAFTVSVAAVQSTLWMIVPVREIFGGLTPWIANGAGIGITLAEIAATGFGRRLDTRKLNHGFVIIAAGALALGAACWAWTRPPLWLALPLLVGSGMVAIQAAPLMGSAPSVTDARRPGKVMARVGGIATVALAVAQWGTTMLADAFGPAPVYLGVGAAAFVSWRLMLRIFTAGAAPAAAHRGFRASWTRRVRIAGAQNLVNAAVIGVYLGPLAGLLHQAGLVDPEWVALPLVMMIVAGLAITFGWSRISDRLPHFGVVHGAAVTAAGAAVLVGADWMRVGSSSWTLMSVTAGLAIALGCNMFQPSLMSATRTAAPATRPTSGELNALNACRAAGFTAGAFTGTSLVYVSLWWHAIAALAFAVVNVVLTLLWVAVRDARPRPLPAAARPAPMAVPVPQRTADPTKGMPIVARLPRKDSGQDVIVARYGVWDPAELIRRTRDVADALTAEGRPWELQVATAWGYQPGAHEERALMLDGGPYQAILDAAQARHGVLGVGTMRFGWTGLTWAVYVEIETDRRRLAPPVARALVGDILAAIPQLGVVAIGRRRPSETPAPRRGMATVA